MTMCKVSPSSATQGDSQMSLCVADFLEVGQDAKMATIEGQVGSPHKPGLADVQRDGPIPKARSA